MPTNKERNSTRSSNQSGMNQQNEKKQSSQADDRISGKSGMSHSSEHQKSSPLRDKDQNH